MTFKTSIKFRVRGRFGPLPRPERWAFVVGCYNSGTSLLYGLLSRHPSVGSLPAEGQFLTDQLPVPKRDGFARGWALAGARYRLTEGDGESIDTERLKRQWGACFNDVSRPILIEKSPPNAARTRWLQSRFDDAHFIGIVRNGYAVAEGISRKAGHPISAAAAQWARSNKWMLRDWPYLERRTLIRYEDLVQNPETVLRGLFRFLSLDPDRYDWSSLAKPMKVHERAEPLKDLNDESLLALSRQQLVDVEDEAMEMLMRLGYWRALADRGGAQA